MTPFVRVVPVLRTPVGVESFDFAVPNGMDADVGALILVPFRNRPTPALVTETLSRTAFADRIKPAVGTYGNIRFPNATVALLQTVAARTFSSQPTVLKAWLRNLPKRPNRATRITDHGSSNAASSPVLSHWSPTPEDKLIENAKRRLKKNERILILVPWLTRAKRMSTTISGARLYANDLNNGDAFRAWSAFLSGETRCLITTRLGAWIGSCADAILLDEPENDDHKQDELSPRYDARWIAHWCAQRANVDVETFGTTPRLTHRGPSDVPDNQLHVPLIVHVRHPSGKTSIPLIQGDTLEALRIHKGPRVIIHPVRGTYARLVCRDCGWRATCGHCQGDLAPNADEARCRVCGKTASLPLSCPSCQGAHLNKSWPGIATLQEAWKKYEPDLDVAWRDLSNESMDAPFPEHALVVVTDGSLLGGASEDIRRRERRLIAFRRLAGRVASSGGSLLIQCHEDLTYDCHAWLTTEGVEAALERERKERELFGYPPAVRLVKIIIQGNEQAAHAWMDRMRHNLPQEANVRGPFAVRFRPSSRSPRWIWHLAFPPSMGDEQLIPLLRPHARGAILDLDPIAFFS